MNCQGDGSRHGKSRADRNRSAPPCGRASPADDELCIKNGSSEQPEMGSSKPKQIFLKTGYEKVEQLQFKQK